MNLKCIFGYHDWSGCKCSKCSKTRSESHKWNGCSCSVCGEVRNLVDVVKEGHLDLVKALLAIGADVNTRDQEGDNALILASRNGHIEIMKVLLANGADVNSRSKFQYSLLDVAVEQGRLDVMQVLFDNGVDVNAKNTYGDCALYIATYSGRPDVVKALLANGADINAKNNLGLTPLCVASSFGFFDVMQVLFDNGVDVNAKNRDGWNCALKETFSCLSSYGKDNPEIRLKAVKLLLANGAEVDEDVSFWNGLPNTTNAQESMKRILIDARKSQIKANEGKSGVISGGVETCDFCGDSVYCSPSDKIALMYDDDALLNFELILGVKRRGGPSKIDSNGKPLYFACPECLRRSISNS